MTFLTLRKFTIAAGSHEELLILDLTASARRRSAKKEPAAVGELDRLTDCPLGAIPRLESFHDDLTSRRQCGLVKTPTAARRSAPHLRPSNSQSRRRRPHHRTHPRNR